jgi:hypothetical protein
MKRIAGLFFFVVIVSLALAANGCSGPETDQANQLVGEVNQLNIEDDLTQTGTLVSQAITEQVTGQANVANQSLSKAQEQLSAASSALQTAKDKLDQAASMNISAEYKSYLQSKQAAVEASLDLVGIFKQEIDIVVTDPGMDQPDSSKKLSDLAGMAEDAAKRARDAEVEATKKAAQSDQIK